MLLPHQEVVVGPGDSWEEEEEEEMLIEHSSFPPTLLPSPVPITPAGLQIGFVLACATLPLIDPYFQQCLLGLELMWKAQKCAAQLSGVLPA